MSERSPNTIPRTTAASRGLSPYPSATSVRRGTRPIQPRSSFTGQMPVASTTAEIRLVDRYESRVTKHSTAPLLGFHAHLGGSETKVELTRS